MSQTVQKKYDFDRVVRMVLTILTIAVGVWLVNYLSPVLMPFVVGFILAYIIEPLVEWLQRKMRSKTRGIAVVLALVIVIAVITGLCWLVIPYLIDEFGAMSKQLAAYAKSSWRNSTNSSPSNSGWTSSTRPHRAHGRWLAVR